MSVNECQLFGLFSLNPFVFEDKKRKLLCMENTQPLNKKKKSQANEQFYELLKELVETQSLILQKLNIVEEKQDKILEKKKSPAELWKDM